MGHRMEIYTDQAAASDLIRISESFGVEARIVGRVEAAKYASVEIISEFGEYTYEK